VVVVDGMTSGGREEEFGLVDGKGDCESVCKGVGVV